MYIFVCFIDVSVTPNSISRILLEILWLPVQLRETVLGIGCNGPKSTNIRREMSPLGPEGAWDNFLSNEEEVNKKLVLCTEAICGEIAFRNGNFAGGRIKSFYHWKYFEYLSYSDLKKKKQQFGSNFFSTTFCRVAVTFDRHFSNADLIFFFVIFFIVYSAEL